MLAVLASTHTRHFQTTGSDLTCRNLPVFELMLQKRNLMPSGASGLLLRSFVSPYSLIYSYG
jgi:hypothetical protein